MTTEEMYGWECCTHEGTGMPGCITCDPDKSRQLERVRYLTEELKRLRVEFAKLREQLREQSEMARSYRNDLYLLERLGSRY